MIEVATGSYVEPLYSCTIQIDSINPITRETVPLQIEDVLYAPAMMVNLLLVTKLNQIGYDVLFPGHRLHKFAEKPKGFVSDSTTGEKILSFTHRRSQFCLDIRYSSSFANTPTIPHDEPGTLSSAASSNSSAYHAGSEGSVSGTFSGTADDMSVGAESSEGRHSPKGDDEPILIEAENQENRDTADPFPHIEGMDAAAIRARLRAIVSRTSATCAWLSPRFSSHAATGLV